MYAKASCFKPFARVIYSLTFLGLLLGSSLAARAEPGVAQPPTPVASQHSVYLPLIAKPGTAPGGPSSDELIDAALKRGEIDAETALIYHVFAAFVDPRLPAKYRGDTSKPSDREVIGEIIDRFSQLPPQAAHNFRFAFTDDKVRSVIFENPFAGGMFPTAHVRAVYRIGIDQWATEDWTDQSYVTFCRDMIDDRVKELYIVISNSEWSDRSHVLKPARTPRLQATNVGCRGWKVDAQFTYAHEGHSSQFTSIVTTAATLERYVAPGARVQVEFYRVASGTAEWTYRGSASICAAEKSGSYDVRNPAIEYMLIVETHNLPYFPPIEPGSRKYHAIGAWPASKPLPTVTYICPNSTYEDFAHLEFWLHTSLQGPPMQHSISADGKTLIGTSTMTMPEPEGTTTLTSKWTMTALPPE